MEERGDSARQRSLEGGDNTSTKKMKTEGTILEQRRLLREETVLEQRR
jgi:hypothetical protein